MTEQYSHGKELALPLLNHPLDAPTVFRPEDLVESVRASRNRSDGDVPEICILEFDGDLTDKLQARGELERCGAWPCFHTTMWRWESGELSCSGAGGSCHQRTRSRRRSICQRAGRCGRVDTGGNMPGRYVVVGGRSLMRERSGRFKRVPASARYWWSSRPHDGACKGSANEESHMIRLPALAVSPPVLLNKPVDRQAAS